jgi:hypothetical protein
MHNPFGVASPCVVFQRPLANENHAGALRVEEGRKRPGHAIPCYSRHFQPWTRPETAKSASSQGEALAIAEREQNPLISNLKDMIMETSS